MSPPSLTFTRELRTSVDVVIRFTPRQRVLKLFTVVVTSSFFQTCFWSVKEFYLKIGRNLAKKVQICGFVIRHWQGKFYGCRK
ncbi:hypothetical protein BDZ97DRAFT_416432 [Flammula alnicola]|nr:hypothetical protein BDZ97DRAFT_416432 [Flammula alnicola]